LGIGDLGIGFFGFNASRLFLNDLTAERRGREEREGLDLVANYDYDNQYQNLKHSQDTTKLLSEV
jgi:hypothetical protein